MRSAARYRMCSASAIARSAGLSGAPAAALPPAPPAPPAPHEPPAPPSVRSSSASKAACSAAQLACRAAVHLRQTACRLSRATWTAGVRQLESHPGAGASRRAAVPACWSTASSRPAYA
eukprot:362581-Chlamydomonas_euryale.AAC.2